MEFMVWVNFHQICQTQISLVELTVLVTFANRNYANYLCHQMQSYCIGGFDNFGKVYAIYLIREVPNIINYWRI